MDLFIYLDFQIILNTNPKKNIEGTRHTLLPKLSCSDIEWKFFIWWSNFSVAGKRGVAVSIRLEVQVGQQCSSPVPVPGKGVNNAATKFADDTK